MAGVSIGCSESHTVCKMCINAERITFSNIDGDPIITDCVLLIFVIKSFLSLFFFPSFQHNNLDLVNTLIVFGADVNVKNFKGETPRHIASTQMVNTFQSFMGNFITSPSFWKCPWLACISSWIYIYRSYGNTFAITIVKFLFLGGVFGFGFGFAGLPSKQNVIILMNYLFILRLLLSHLCLGEGDSVQKLKVFICHIPRKRKIWNNIYIDILKFKIIQLCHVC